MAVTPETIRRAAERERNRTLYDRRGRRIPTRAEWEQLSRWRRWRDILCGWQPPEEYRYHWER